MGRGELRLNWHGSGIFGGVFDPGNVMVRSGKSVDHPGVGKGAQATVMIVLGCCHGDLSLSCQGGARRPEREEAVWWKGVVQLTEIKKQMRNRFMRKMIKLALFNIQTGRLLYVYYLLVYVFINKSLDLWRANDVDLLGMDEAATPIGNGGNEGYKVQRPVQCPWRVLHHSDQEGAGLR